MAQEIKIDVRLGKFADIAAKEGTRYAIHGIYVERRSGKATVAATDGKRIAIAEWDDAGEDMEAIVPAALWRMIASHSYKTFTLSLDGKTLCLTSPQGFKILCDLDTEARYPKVAEVLDVARAEKRTYGLDPRLLAPLMGAMMAVAPDDKHILELGEPNKPFLIRTEDSIMEPRITCLLMPLNMGWQA